MVIIITGSIGVGKTTVCRTLTEITKNSGYTCGGILTYKAPNQDIYVEDVHTGKTETIASPRNVFDGPQTCKYFFNPAGIDFGIQAIDRGILSDILLVDEIGYLELRGQGFIRVPEVILAGKVKDCVLVIRKELLPYFLPQLPNKLVVFETTLSNRNRLPQVISSALSKKLH